METAALNVVAILGSSFLITTAILGFMFFYESTRRTQVSRSEEVEEQAIREHFRDEGHTGLTVIK